MFKSISWQQFITYFFVLLVLYYLLVVLLYFKKDLRMAWVKSRKPEPKKSDFTSDPNEKDLFVVASSLKSGVAEIVAEGQEKNWIKEELLQAIQRRIEPDLKLRGTAFQPALNNYIQQLAFTECQINVDEDDLRRLW